MQNQMIYAPDGRVIWSFPVGDSRGWPYKSVNGQQTEASKALQSAKGQHKPTPKDLNDIEDALL